MELSQIQGEPTAEHPGRLQVLAVCSDPSSSQICSNWEESQLFHPRAAHHFISLSPTVPSQPVPSSLLLQVALSTLHVPRSTASCPHHPPPSPPLQCQSALHHPPTLPHLEGNHIWNKGVISHNEINFAMPLTSDLSQLLRISSPAL